MKVKKFSLVFIIPVTLCLFMFLLISNSAETITAAPAMPTYDCAAQSNIPEVECEALVAIYNANPDGDFGSEWLELDSSPCSWGGVTCDTDYIKELVLGGHELTTIPLEVGNLTNLTFLYLSNNSLTALPSQIGDLTSLQELTLSNNQLGSLPSQIGNMINLQKLKVDSNQLTSLPPEIGELINLQYLHLHDNKLTTLPPEIGNLVNLSGDYHLIWSVNPGLSLSKNQLQSLPPEIGNLTNLVGLTLHENKLITLPSEIGNLTNLVSFPLRDNRLTELPPEIGNLSNLAWRFNLSNNELTSLPPGIGNLTRLLFLHLEGNRLTTLPPEIGNLTQLDELHANDNQLTSLPSEIGSMVGLEELFLHKNKLTTLPPEFGDMGCLYELDLHDNRLTELPEEIGSLCANELYLNENWLTELPPRFGDIGGGSTLDLSDNKLTTLPSGMGNLEFAVLNLSENNLSTLPSEFGNQSDLHRLGLSSNRFNTLPIEVTRLPLLSSLSLVNNKITDLPPEIGNMSELGYFNLSYNVLSDLPPEIGDLDDLDELDLSGNQIKTLPPEIADLSNLEELDLSENRLIELPPEMGNSPLYLLNVSHNKLEAIPLEIGNMANIQYLDLSRNELTELPPEIGNLSFLKGLLLEGNSFSGALPAYLTSLSLESFSFYDTLWCEPDNVIVQEWLAQVDTVFSTGYICNQPFGAISGQIIMSNTLPAPHTQVILHRVIPYDMSIWWGVGQHREQIEKTQADSQGNYHFRALGRGVDYYIEAFPLDDQFKHGFYPDAVTVTLGATTENVDIVIEEAYQSPVSVTTVSGAVSTYLDDGHVMVVQPEDDITDITISYDASCADGSVPSEVDLRYLDRRYPMTKTEEDGDFQVTLHTQDISNASLYVDQYCDDVYETKIIGSLKLVYPVVLGGSVTNSRTDSPVENAVVTFYKVPNWQSSRSPDDTGNNMCESRFSKAIDEPWRQAAPTHLGMPYSFYGPNRISRQRTGTNGEFVWGRGGFGEFRLERSSGCWYVYVQADGYLPAYSPVVGIPTLADDLNVRLLPLENAEHVYLPLVANE